MRFLEEPERNITADFFPRDYFTPLKQIVPFYVLALAASIAIFYFSGHESYGFAVVISCLLIVGSGVYTFIRLQQSNDLITASDFQNLLFATASSIGSAFCMYVRRDGTVVYANDGTLQMFPKFSFKNNQFLEVILRESQVSTEDTNKLYSALTRAKKETLIFSIRDPKGVLNDYILSVEPLPRPSGYFVIHGRVYNQARTAKIKIEGVFSQSDPEKVEALVEGLPLGAYITSETGLLEYANPTFSDLVGLSADVAQRTAIQSLVTHSLSTLERAFGTEDYTGHAELRHAKGHTVKVYLEHRQVFNSKGEKLGYYGVVTPL